MIVEQATLAGVVVLMGYVYLSSSNYDKPRLASKANNAIFYESAVAGGLLFVVGWVITAGLKAGTTGCNFQHAVLHQDCWGEGLFPFPHFDVVIVAIVLGGCLLFVLNKVNQEQAVAEEIARDHGLIENFILDAVRRYYEVQVTTVRGRVYVGVLVEGPDSLSTDGKIESIAIVPIESGYRDPVLQSVKLEENNWQAIEDRILAIPEEVRQDDVRISTLLNELSVVIPINEIALLKRSWVDVGTEIG